MAEEWTPYALEPLRAKSLWRRRWVALAAFIVLAVLLVLVLATRPEPIYETQVSLSNGEDSDQVEIEVRTQDEFRSRPLRVELKPGGITHAGTGLQPDEDRLSRADVNYPYIRGERPINFLGMLVGWGPLLLLGWLVWSAGRGQTNPVAEVNFGIYKGAMPIEMITASYRHLVVTQRVAKGPIFGKEREDYVPADLVPRKPVAFEPVRRR